MDRLDKMRKCIGAAYKRNARIFARMENGGLGHKKFSELNRRLDKNYAFREYLQDQIWERLGL